MGLNDRSGRDANWGNSGGGGYRETAPDEITVSGGGGYRPGQDTADPWNKPAAVDFTNPHTDNLAFSGRNDGLTSEQQMLGDLIARFDAMQGGGNKGPDKQKTFWEAVTNVLGISNLLELPSDIKTIVNSAARMVGVAGPGDDWVAGNQSIRIGDSNGNPTTVQPNNDAFSPIDPGSRIGEGTQTGWENGNPNANMQGPLNTVIPTIGTDGIENIIVYGNHDGNVHILSPNDLANIPSGFTGLENYDFGGTGQTPETQPPGEPVPGEEEITITGEREPPIPSMQPTQVSGGFTNMDPIFGLIPGNEDAYSPPVAPQDPEDVEEIVVRAPRPTGGTPGGMNGEPIPIPSFDDMMPTLPAPEVDPNLPVGEGEIEITAPRPTNNPPPVDIPRVNPTPPVIPDLGVGPEIPPSTPPATPPYYGTPPTNTPPPPLDPNGGGGGGGGNPPIPPVVVPPPPTPRPRQAFRFFDMPEFELLDKTFGQDRGMRTVSVEIQNDGRVSQPSSRKDDDVPNFAQHG